MKSTTVYVPSSELGLSQPLSRSECAPPTRTGDGGAQSPAGEGVGVVWFIQAGVLIRYVGDFFKFGDSKFKIYY